MSLGCIANDIVRIETSYASGDQRHLVQEYQYVVKDAKERYLVFDIINSESFCLEKKACIIIEIYGACDGLLASLAVKILSSVTVKNILPRKFLAFCP